MGLGKRAKTSKLIRPLEMETTIMMLLERKLHFVKKLIINKSIGEIVDCLLKESRQNMQKIVAEELLLNLFRKKKLYVTYHWKLVFFSNFNFCVEKKSFCAERRLGQKPLSYDLTLNFSLKKKLLGVLNFSTAGWLSSWRIFLWPSIFLYQPVKGLLAFFSPSTKWSTTFSTDAARTLRQLRTLKCLSSGHRAAMSSRPRSVSRLALRMPTFSTHKHTGYVCLLTSLVSKNLSSKSTLRVPVVLALCSILRLLDWTSLLGLRLKNLLKVKCLLTASLLHQVKLSALMFMQRNSLYVYSAHQMMPCQRLHTNCSLSSSTVFSWQNMAISKKSSRQLMFMWWLFALAHILLDFASSFSLRATLSCSRNFTLWLSCLTMLWFWYNGPSTELNEDRERDTFCLLVTFCFKQQSDLAKVGACWQILLLM
ncbi:hypothetical protein BpHYR1_054085 [Brachionus plicatilis]|uniref:Uncharacterized protein n=1 Tax=Brachionus plicatilis TaxID=10195 RepID=A0A3M7RX90_BRAPC|nr:hypothetical protein BpHYR1_054085 [Brachionus plicatilis]